MSAIPRRSEHEPKRAANACQRCRHSKLKCSGSQPCDRCRRRNKECIFDDKEKRVVVTESYLDTLRRAAQTVEDADLQRDSLAGPEILTRPPIAQPPPPTEVPAAPEEAATEKDTPSFFLRNRPNKRRRWLYLGTSSTWSFNIRAESIIKEHLPDAGPDEDNAFSLDGDAYNFSWKHVSSEERPDLSRLPSLDFAIYLTNTVKFHLGGLLRLFDEEDFLKQLHEFYAEAPEKVGSSRLWYTQYLLVLAFGKGFLNGNKTPGSLSGSEFFTRAMSVLPNTSELHEEPVLAVEVLSLIALYFHCLDMRQTAYSYIGQALRIALVDGMHTRIPAALLGEKLTERCSNIWWTVYILDRTLSSAVGSPTSVHDEDIKAYLAPPQQSSQRSATLSLHVRLSRLISQILNELYSADGSLEASYLSKIRSVLRRLAAIAEELEGTINFKFKSSLETLSKGATHLRLLYHQCIILAIRPLLLCLLQERLKSFHDGSESQSLTASIRDLLQTCADSATKTLAILSALAENNMLDNFLPFDLEFASSAASVLIILDDVLKLVAIGPSVKRRAGRILLDMKQRGSIPAQLRQKELDRLNRLARRLWERRPSVLPAGGNAQMATGELQRTTADAVEGPGYALGPNNGGNSALGSPTNRRIAEQNIMHAGSTSVAAGNQPFSFSSPTQTHSTTPLDLISPDLAEHFELAQEHMLFVADQLNNDADDALFFSNMDFTGSGDVAGAGGNWLWSSLN